MEIEVEKKVTVKLELTQEEFNSIVAAYGKTSHRERLEGGKRHGLNVIENDYESHKLYQKLYDTAKSI